MKYKKIKGIIHDNDRWEEAYKGFALLVVCASCGRELSGEEKYCPECGHKLRPLMTEIPCEKIIELLSLHSEELIRNDAPGKKKEGEDDVADANAARQEPLVIESCHLQR